MLLKTNWKDGVFKDTTVPRGSFVSLIAKLAEETGLTNDEANIEIPKLATGAVLPANREFLALVGDQKHGTNVEAPLDTIRQAQKDAIMEGVSESEQCPVIRRNRGFRGILGVLEALIFGALTAILTATLLQLLFPVNASKMTKGSKIRLKREGFA